MRISWLIGGVAAVAFIGTFALAHYRASYQAQAERTVASMLRDPGSAKFSGVRMIKHRGLEVACGYVTAKNGIGEYAEEAQFVTFGATVYLIGARSTWAVAPRPPMPWLEEAELEAKCWE